MYVLCAVYAYNFYILSIYVTNFPSIALLFFFFVFFKFMLCDWQSITSDINTNLQKTGGKCSENSILCDWYIKLYSHNTADSVNDTTPDYFSFICSLMNTTTN